MTIELVRRLRSGDRAAVAEALNLVEDERPAQREMADAMLAELEGREEEQDPGAARVWRHVFADGNRARGAGNFEVARAAPVDDV